MKKLFLLAGTSVTLTMLFVTLAPKAMTAPSDKKRSGGPSYELESNAAINKALWNKTVEKVVEKGLKYLDDKGKNKKSWGTTQKLVATSMVGLSFLSHGDTLDRGEYCENIRKGVEYLLDTQTEQGFLAQEAGGTMHGHGYGMLFLAEAYGTGQPLAKGTSSNRDLDKRIQKALQKAVDLSIKSQDHTGGWGYSPGNGAGHEGSITVPVVQGIRAARNCGFKVDKKIIDKGLDYMFQTYDGKGGFSYNLGMKGSPGSVALGAAGATVLIMYGDQSDKTHEILKACFDRLKREAFPGRGANNWGFYTIFYATQAMCYKGGKDWESWYKALVEDLRKRQAEDGSWNGSYGPEFETGFMLLCLQLPNSYLPVFQKQ